MTYDIVHHTGPPMIHMQQPLQRFPSSSCMHNHPLELQQEHYQNQENTMQSSRFYSQQNFQNAHAPDSTLSWNILPSNGVQQFSQFSKTSQCYTAGSTTSQENLTSVRNLPQTDPNITGFSNTQLKTDGNSQARVVLPSFALLTGNTSVGPTQNETKTSSSVSRKDESTAADQSFMDTNPLGNDFTDSGLNLAELDLLTGLNQEANIEATLETTTGGDYQTTSILQEMFDRYCLPSFSDVSLPTSTGGGTFDEHSLTSELVEDLPSNAEYRES